MTQFWNRGKGGGVPPKVILAGFGKHPAWSEHVQDLGDFSETLAAMRGTIYGEGILKLMAQWENLSPEARCDLDHWMTCILPEAAILGRIVDSTDLAGRRDYPFIILLEITGCRLDWVLRRLAPYLDDFIRRCQKLPTPEAVRGAFASEKVALESLAAGAASATESFAPTADERAAFVSARGMDEDGVAIARLLYKVQTSWAAYAPTRGSRNPKTQTGGAALRVPAVQGQMPSSVLLWEEFVSARVAPEVPRLYVVPAAHDWIDLVVGRAEGGHFLGLRSGRAGLVPETEVPYTVTAEMLVEGKSAISAWRSGPPTDQQQGGVAVAPFPAGILPEAEKPASPAVVEPPRAPARKGRFWTGVIVLFLMAAVAGLWFFKDYRKPVLQSRAKPTNGPVQLATAPKQQVSTVVIQPVAQRPRTGEVPPSGESSNVATIPTAAPPAISPNGGTRLDSVTISIASTTAATRIFYTTDGSEPTISSSLYAGPFALTNSATIKARAFQNGFKDSPVVTAIFTVTPTPRLPQTTVIPNGGSHRDSVTVTLANGTEGAKIHYTTDGSEPTVSSPLYGGPFALSSSATIKARAVKDGFKDSPVATVMFTVTPTPTLPQPTVSPNGGGHRDSVTVTLACATKESKIHYTTNGIEPTASSTLYGGPFVLASSAIIKARAVKDGFKASPVVTASFEVTPTPTALQPTINPAGGTHQDSVTVTIVSATAGAKVHYSTDGSEPTTSSAGYGDPIVLTNSTTIKARAFKEGFKASPVTSATFVVLPTAVPQDPDQETLRNLTNELAAFRVWFDLRRNDATPKILNPPGYEVLGVVSGRPAARPPDFSRQRKVMWEDKAKDLLQRCVRHRILTESEGARTRAQLIEGIRLRFARD